MCVPCKNLRGNLSRLGKLQPRIHLTLIHWRLTLTLGAHRCAPFSKIPCVIPKWDSSRVLQELGFPPPNPMNQHKEWQTKTPKNIHKPASFQATPSTSHPFWGEQVFPKPSAQGATGFPLKVPKGHFWGFLTKGNFP